MKPKTLSAPAKLKRVEATLRYYLDGGHSAEDAINDLCVVLEIQRTPEPPVVDPRQIDIEDAIAQS